MIRRRRFLAVVAGALLPDWNLLTTGSGFSDDFTDRELTPGRSITVWWPRIPEGLDAWVEHLHDGREVGRTPTPPPTGTVFRKIVVTPAPRGESLMPGRHDFRLAYGGKRVGLGRLDVAPFHFGC